MGSIYEIPHEDIERLEVDPLAKLTMTYTAEGLEELRNDILANGQIMPIKLREGKIIDGRHRKIVCSQLSVSIKCEELGNISDEEALAVVISNSINKATNSDASKTEAYLICKAKGVSKTDMPKVFKRLNSNYVSKLSYIEKINPEYLSILLHQNKVRLYNAEYKKVEDYGTINGLWRTLKGNIKLEGEVIEVIPEPVQSSSYSIDLVSYFENEHAENEYWELFNTAKSDGVNLHPDTELGKKVASLIKHKHSS